MILATLTTTNLITLIGTAGSLVIATYAFIRGSRADDAKAESDDAKTVANNASTVVSGFSGLVSALQGEITRQAGKIVEQGAKIDEQAEHIRAQDRRIEQLESDVQSCTDREARQQTENQALRNAVRELGGKV